MQTVSIVIKGGIGEVSRHNGVKTLRVPFPNYVIMHQKYMGSVDRGDQNRVIDAGFATASYFKKLHNTAFLVMCNFSFLQAFTVWNLSVDDIDRTRRGGIQQRKKITKMGIPFCGG